MCPQSCTSSGEGAGRSTPGWGQGTRSCGGGCVSGWEEGAAGWTPMDQGHQATAWRGEGWRPPILGLSPVLVQRLVKVRVECPFQAGQHVHLPWAPCARHLHSVGCPISLAPEE